ncbi:DUF485 domain-containing protein [Caballeronia sp. AZ10_KS36]|uniref:DUF485 domain-containing protein n=1 Tax=Caballeronia sp. AZ10_KS36 TaxID=2921757 RepID=UPI0020292872|nr:DUF485 domain-containing protein [Caballeronia sp. AZ10_KS36]
MQTITSEAVVSPPPSSLRSVAVRRQRVSLCTTLALLIAHFAFITSIAYYKQLLSYELMPGLSLAIAVGFATVGFALALTFGYVVWVDKIHDKSIRELRKGGM